MIRLHGFWFAVILTVCVVAPYLLGVRPKTRKQWSYVAITIAFLAWVLFMAPLRAR